MSFGYALHPPAGGTQQVVRAPGSATGAHRARRERQHARCRRPCLCRRRHGRRRRRGRKAQAAWPRVVLGGVQAGGTDLYAGVMTSRGSVVHGVVNTKSLAAPLCMLATRFADGAEIRMAPVLAKQRSFAEHPRRGERSCAVPCAAPVRHSLRVAGAAERGASLHQTEPLCTRQCCSAVLAGTRVTCSRTAAACFKRFRCGNPIRSITS